MTLNDPVANVLSYMQNAETRGNNTVTTTNNSVLIRKILDIMQQAGYIEGYTVTPDSKGDSLTIKLFGKINKTGVIKPRYKVKKDEFEKFEKRFLPARGFGVLMVSTNQGLLTHEEAKEKGVGGVLISYCY